MNNDIGFFDVIDINEPSQGSSGIMPAMKKGKLCVNVHQVDGSDQVHTLWPMRFCPKAGANLFSLMCKLLQGKMMSSNHCNNIVIDSMEGKIILDCWIKN